MRLDVIYYHLLKVITMHDAASSRFNVCPCADVLTLFWLSLHFKMSAVSSLMEKNAVVFAADFDIEVRREKRRV